ncbi:MAG TPA: ester cyclase [bacterium]|jgi:predicted ester cyclase
MAESKQIAMYRAVCEDGIGKGDLKVVDRFIAPNMKEHETGVEPPNSEGLKNLIRMMHTAFPDLRVTVEDVWEMGDTVIGRITWTGTHTGPLGDIPPTRKKVNVTGIDIVRFSGDKCVEHWGVTDRMSMMEQLGVVQPMQA